MLAAGRPVPPVPLTDELADRLWQQAILELGGTVAGSAAHADRITAAEGDLLVAAFPASYSFCRDICDHVENRPRLEQALSDAYGAPVRLRVRHLRGSAVGPHGGAAGANLAACTVERSLRAPVR